MTPISIIRKKYVQEPEIVDLETVGARLKYHKVYIEVRNSILSDGGDEWICKVSHHNHDKQEHFLAPSLRGAVIKALKEAETWQ